MVATDGSSSDGTRIRKQSDVERDGSTYRASYRDFVFGDELWERIVCRTRLRAMGIR